MDEEIIVKLCGCALACRDSSSLVDREDYTPRRRLKANERWSLITNHLFHPGAQFGDLLPWP